MFHFWKIKITHFNGVSGCHLPSWSWKFPWLASCCGIASNVLPPVAALLVVVSPASEPSYRITPRLLLLCILQQPPVAIVALSHTPGASGGCTTPRAPGIEWKQTMCRISLLSLPDGLAPHIVVPSSNKNVPLSAHMSVLGTTCCFSTLFSLIYSFEMHQGSHTYEPSFYKCILHDESRK